MTAMLAVNYGLVEAHNGSKFKNVNPSNLTLKMKTLKQKRHLLSANPGN